MSSKRKSINYQKLQELRPVLDSVAEHIRRTQTSPYEAAKVAFTRVLVQIKQAGSQDDKRTSDSEQANGPKPS